MQMNSLLQDSEEKVHLPLMSMSNAQLTSYSLHGHLKSSLLEYYVSRSEHNPFVTHSHTHSLSLTLLKELAFVSYNIMCCCFFCGMISSRSGIPLLCMCCCIIEFGSRVQYCMRMACVRKPEAGKDILLRLWSWATVNSGY